MALVDDDEVEEVGRVFPVEAGAVLVLGDGLVGGKVHLAALDRLAFDLQAGIAERGEVLSFGSSTRMLRSARKRIRGRLGSPVRFQREFQSFQQI